MSASLELGLAPERLDEGSPEERAAFGVFTIRSSEQYLTEGFDCFLNSLRPGPLVSGYHVAQWFAWNWWRLRWEPRSAVEGWPFAHRMNTIGEGYVWPNIDIWSDGVRTMLISSPSVKPDSKPFRYSGAFPTIVPSSQFEGALDEFLPRIMGRLRSEGVAETNLDRLWRDVLAERADPELTKRRRLEALMGRDPDAVDDDAVETLVRDANRLGEDAVREVAAEHGRAISGDKTVLTAQVLEDIAREVGFRASPGDAVVLSTRDQLPDPADVPGWVLGRAAAVAVREQEKLGEKQVPDQRLAQLVGTTPDALINDPRKEVPLSYALDETAGHDSRVVLLSHYKTGRRFALARLLGDRLMYPDGALHAATQAYTYRQKAQRSFAAEFLAPFDAVEDMLQGDYSEEKQQEVSEYFAVSPMVIDTLLKNHKRIERDQSDEDLYPKYA
ncbi:ImmA/IrrE family metallo-endopeptidase [Pararhodospirillum oryzae]|uniref:Uncharacterized protein n=1 Tax=Pararhodospirillum oryzae TaxID=478448 RepID=A0A512H568_9PROT|nr:hypothetical protein [Pararhodospirillum oryzae]GEO80578.1 hypothetical protein ROR02_07090 [Pararhodospirillum oryzae]